MAAERLGLRALNRATLARQLLLERSPMAPREAVAHLVGMQAQQPLDPYVGLWSRLAGFRPDDLGRLLLDRELVRIVAMRGTIHLLTAADCLVLRPLSQPVMDAEIARHSEYAPLLRGVDMAPVLAAARLILAEPRTIPQLRAALVERFPELSAPALAYACRCLLALVQVPPRGVWGRSAQVTLATAESWLGRPLDPEPSLVTAVARYLAAFGPATTADVAAWSRLTGLGEVLEEMRPGLRAFRDERGRTLFDLPDAPRPDPETPAPVRFLPEYDNVLLSHADRSRVIADETRRRLAPAYGPGRGSVLLDGMLVAAWGVERDRKAGTATLVVRHAGRLPRRAAASIAAEGRRLLRMTDAGAGARAVRVVAIGGT